MTFNVGMNPYMMGGDIMTNNMMMGMGGMMMNPQMQIANMNQWDQYGVDRQVNMYKQQNNAQFQMSAQTDRLYRQVQILNEKVQGNNQNHIQDEYAKLVQSVKDTYTSQGAPDTQAELQAKAFAERVYAQQTGSLLTADIRKNSKGSFLEGMAQVLTFGLGNRKTSEENIAKINGTKLSTMETSKKYAGYAAGGTTLALGGTVLYKYSKPIGEGIIKALKFLFTKA